MNAQIKIILLLIAASIAAAFFFKERDATALPQTDVIVQTTRTDCGVAAAKNVLVAFNKNPMVIDTLLNAGDDGVTLLDIKRALTKCGLNCTGYKTTADELSKLGLPAIAHINDNHFVVVETIADESVVLIDPSIGRVKYRASLFEDKWDGVALCVSEKH